tara:strand:- start:261 stop:527 length:267 start_codon:yes stop_codon:yes gene_type:complete
MASLRNRGGNWYVGVQSCVDGSRIEKSIFLRTKSKVTAHEIIAEVNKVEGDIKQGMEFSFPRLFGSIVTKVQRFTIYDAIEQWLSQKI